MGTPHTLWREMHQSGRVAIIFEMRCSPDAGVPLHFLDGIQRLLAQAVPVHADKPLLGSPENRRVMAAPAVRVAVLDLARRRQGLGVAEQVHHDGVSFPDGLADQRVREPPFGALGLIEAARAVDGAIHADPVRPSDLKVLHSPVAWSGMNHGSGPLFQRYLDLPGFPESFVR